MKKSLLVLALLFSLATFSQSPVDKSFPPEELFALGSYYYPLSDSCRGGRPHLVR